MNLKKRIEEDFVTAMKERNTAAKSALSMLKSDITNAEKAAGNRELSDDEVLKVVITSSRKRKESIDLYRKGGNTSQAEEEEAQLSHIEKYMPARIEGDELRSIISQEATDYFSTNPGSVTEPRQKTRGILTGRLNKKFPGSIDMKELSSLMEEVIG